MPHPTLPCPRFISCIILLACAVVVFVTGASSHVGAREPQEVQFPNDRFEHLDTFEGNRLNAADQLYRQGNYEAALAAYDAFILEFGDSDATAYALLRKARCVHQLRRRHDAIRDYQEVIDYFPDEVAFAAPAAFHIGECHWQNGDRAQALAAWARMVRDPEYVRHPLAATALNHLAEGMIAQGNFAQATEYNKQVAIHFRRDNPEAARDAAEAVVHHYIRRAPDEEALRTFYEAYGGFGRHPEEIREAENTWPYWNHVRRWVQEHGRFSDDEQELAAHHYGYWADALAPHMPEREALHLDVALFRRRADGDVGAWMEQVDALFQRGYTEGDWGRILEWIRVYEYHPEKVAAYFRMLDPSNMDNGQMREVMNQLRRRDETKDMAVAIFGRMRLGEMEDGDLARLANEVRDFGDAAVERVAGAISDKSRGQWELLQYYRRVDNVEKGLPLADALAENPDYAARAIWAKAELLQRSKRYEEAIAAYRQVENAPANSWRIAECHESLGQVPQAVQVLREVENFFEDQAPRAAREVAMVYRRAGMESEYVGQLRRVMHRYPRTQEASFAHNELERLGHRIGGGVDED